MKTTLCCLIQNRLGAMDRVLGTLTYRGYIPEEMVSTMDTQSGCIQMMVTFECEEQSHIDKLVKMLNKQVTVLETRQMTLDKQETLPAPSQQSKVAFMSSMTSPITSPKRRIAHVQHA
jgi:acetolactate synthase small subunit